MTRTELESAKLAGIEPDANLQAAAQAAVRMQVVLLPHELVPASPRKRLADIVRELASFADDDDELSTI